MFRIYERNMKRKLYTLDEAQKIWTLIIKKRAQELKNETNTDEKTLKDAWFDFDQIKSILKWNEQVDKNIVYSEEEFYSRLEKRVYSNSLSNV